MSAVARWIEPLKSAVPELVAADWTRLLALDSELDVLTVNSPGPAAAQADRSSWLLSVRRHLASRDYARPTNGLLQTLLQFVCGFHDVDLRDATGLGQGAMVGRAIEPVRTMWTSRLARGDLVGIAATERHGGTRVQEIATRAFIVAEDRWEISGEKTWVSRLREAHGFVVFFREPGGDISAAIVDATASGLVREPVTPAGLAGWTWGSLRFERVAINPQRDLIGGPGEGLTVFREHFSSFRPLVAATALGAAAAAHTLVTDTLAAKVSLGILPRVRDNAMIVIGRTYSELIAELVNNLHAARLAARRHRSADLHARLSKATGVDAALQALNDLAPLVGAPGFQATSRLVKARDDLTALLYADGIHDSLYRSGGKSLLRAARPDRLPVVAPASG